MREQPQMTGSGDAAVPLVGVLSNRESTRNRKSFERLQGFIARKPHVFHIEISDIADVPSALKMFADARVALVAVNGGDGTIQAVLSHLHHDTPFASLPLLAILPGGKTNMIANDLGVRGTPQRVLGRLLKRVRKNRLRNRIVARPVIALDPGDGQPERLGLFFGGAGLVNAILWCRAKVHTRRLGSEKLEHGIAILLLALSLLSPFHKSPIEASEMSLETGEGETISGRFSLVIATTLRALLFNLKPFGRRQDGAIGFSFVDSGTKAVLCGLLALLTGRFGRRTVGGIHAGRTDRLIIRTQDPVTLDGEIYTPGKDNTVVLKSTAAFRFLRP